MRFYCANGLVVLRFAHLRWNITRVGLLMSAEETCLILCGLHVDNGGFQQKKIKVMCSLGQLLFYLDKLF